MENKRVLIELINEKMVSYNSAYRNNPVVGVTYRYVPQDSVAEVHLDFEVIEIQWRDGQKLNVVLKSYVSTEQDDAALVDVVSGEYGVDFSIDKMPSEYDDNEMELSVVSKVTDENFINELKAAGVLVEKERLNVQTPMGDNCVEKYIELEEELFNGTLDYSVEASRQKSEKYFLNVENYGLKAQNKHKRVKRLAINGGPLYILDSVELNEEYEKYKAIKYFGMQDSELLKQQKYWETKLTEYLNSEFAEKVNVQEGQVQVVPDSIDYQNNIDYNCFDNQWQISCMLSKGDKVTKINMVFSETERFDESVVFNYLKKDFEYKDSCNELKQMISDVEEEFKGNSELNTIFNELLQVRMIIDDRRFTKDLLEKNPSLSEYIQQLVYTSGIIGFIITKGDDITPILNDAVIAVFID